MFQLVHVLLPIDNAHNTPNVSVLQAKLTYVKLDRVSVA